MAPTWSLRGGELASLEDAAHEVTGAGRRCITVPTDIREVAQCRALIDRTVAESGPPSTS